MQLIPAIDLKDGQCVRLKQGRMEDATVFSDDPVAMAVHWQEQGCQRLHIVDLDGAFAGKPKNRELIRSMTEAIAGTEVQVGGGIRDLATIEAYLEAGVHQVIIGTRAVDDPPFLEEAAEAFPNAVILGLDARDGQIATAGWDVLSDQSAVRFAHWAGQLPLAAIVYTDIHRDGMLTGVNIPATVELAEATNLPVIASGGVSTLEDLTQLREAFMASSGTLLGAITGRAIYSGSLNYAAGQALLARTAA